MSIHIPILKTTLLYCVCIVSLILRLDEDSHSVPHYFDDRTILLFNSLSDIIMINSEDYRKYEMYVFEWMRIIPITMMLDYGYRIGSTAYVGFWLRYHTIVAYSYMLSSLNMLYTTQSN